VSETESGITTMRRRMERGQRRPPPARRAPAPGEGEGEGAAPEAPLTPGPGSSPGPGGPARAPRAALPADAPAANLAIRVRRPLDEHLADLIHQLRRRGVRTSKVELIEVLLWELPERATPELVERLARFRRAAPRGPGAPLEG
jgi:hypothetical protein